MGVVYLAEQTEPVKRRVALKVIKLGMDSKQVVARFESERQALALMDHPAIAKVLDAGTTPEGRPYFAMDFCPGVPVTEYCDRRRLGVRERLTLFEQICEGVQHAHQKALIHRDLKPSNILVADVDGKPQPRIIDIRPRSHRPAVRHELAVQPRVGLVRKRAAGLSEETPTGYSFSVQDTE